MSDASDANFLFSGSFPSNLSREKKPVFNN